MITENFANAFKLAVSQNISGIVSKDIEISESEIVLVSLPHSKKEINKWLNRVKKTVPTLTFNNLLVASRLYTVIRP